MTRSLRPLRRSVSLDLTGQGCRLSTLRLTSRTGPPTPALELNEEQSSCPQALPTTPDPANDADDAGFTVCGPYLVTPDTIDGDLATPATAVEPLDLHKELAEDTNHVKDIYSPDAGDTHTTLKLLDGDTESDKPTEVQEHLRGTNDEALGLTGIHLPGDSDIDGDETQTSAQPSTSQSTTASPNAPLELSPLLGFLHLEDLPQAGAPFDLASEYPESEGEGDTS